MAPGIFRNDYRTLSEDERAHIGLVKTKAQELYEALYRDGADPRCLAVARTKLEEAVMWAVKGITG